MRGQKLHPVTWEAHDPPSEKLLARDPPSLHRKACVPNLPFLRGIELTHAADTCFRKNKRDGPILRSQFSKWHLIFEALNSDALVLGTGFSVPKPIFPCGSSVWPPVGASSHENSKSQRGHGTCLEEGECYWKNSRVLFSGLCMWVLPMSCHGISRTTKDSACEEQDWIKNRKWESVAVAILTGALLLSISNQMTTK